MFAKIFHNEKSLIPNISELVNFEVNTTTVYMRVNNDFSALYLDWIDFLLNWVRETSFNSVYKNDICHLNI